MSINNLNDKKFLIFTGIGDNHQGEFLSWASEESNLYDRAVNYYGDSESFFVQVKEMKTEYTFKGKGEIWVNFAKNYDLFRSYEYVLVVDSDLFLKKNDIEDTFLMAYNNKWTACQWSRHENSHGIFVPLYKQMPNSTTRMTNFIEMCFMMVSKDLLSLLVKKYNELNLEWGEGIDFILSNVALENKLLPFYIIDKYSFYNPHPFEKPNGREIDFGTNSITSSRLKQINEIMNSNRQYFRINRTVECDGIKLNRYNGCIKK